MSQNTSWLQLEPLCPIASRSLSEVWEGICGCSNPWVPSPQRMGPLTVFSNEFHWYIKGTESKS